MDLPFAVLDEGQRFLPEVCDARIPGVEPGGSVRGERANFSRLVLGCIEASKQASKVEQPNFASKYSLESSRRDLHNALLCTALQCQNFR